jgi:hypothetical protein
MLAHYVAAWYYVLLVQTHILYVHEMWDADSSHSTQQDSATPKGSWGWDAIKREVLLMLGLFALLGCSFYVQMHPDARPVNFGYFEQ